MFLYKGYYFRNVRDMLYYALVDDSYAELAVNYIPF